MDEIIVFDKSYHERYQDYVGVFGEPEMLPASKVRQEWSGYLEQIIDPCGWQAIWRIPCSFCEYLKISYPTVALIYVENVDFDNLTADVNVLTTQENVNLPETLTTNLKNLWPTKKQDDTVCLNIEKTADALDMLRFFDNHLWMPWDVDEDDCNWFENHLKIRLRLYYDAKLEIIPKKFFEQFRSLVAEAKMKQRMIDSFEETDTDDDINIETDTDDDINIETPVPLNVIKLDNRISSLVKLQKEMTNLKTQIEMIEDPEKREWLIKKRTMEEQTILDRDHSNYWLIFQSDCDLDVDTHIEYLRFVNSFISKDTECKNATSLQNALESADPNDIIMLSSGSHHVYSSGVLKNGGTLKGVYNSKYETIIESTNENLIFDFSAEKVLLENLTINVNDVHRGIMINSGCVTIRNCILIGNGRSSVQQAIVVMEGSKLHLENCEIKGFANSIFADSRSNVTMHDCIVSNARIALKICDKIHLNIKQCKFLNCEQYAIQLEMMSELKPNQQQIGDESLLKSIQNIIIEDCKYESIGKGNVIIEQRSQLIPIRDLFSNPAFNNITMKN